MNGSEDILAWALLYFENFGWGPVLVPERGKTPIEPGWQDRDIDREWIESAFGGRVRRNIGIRLGGSSNNLVDIDLDCEEAVLFAPRFLPPTPWVFGRATRRRSHWLYTCETETKQLQWPLEKSAVDAHGKPKSTAMVIEVRSTGVQTVFPPSVHETTGEAIEWDGDPEGTPPVVEASVLHQAAARVAFASMLHRHFPGQGHNARLALAGWLARSAWDEEFAADFMSTVMEVRGHGGDDVRSLVADTYRRLKTPEDGKPVMGFPKLVELMGLTEAQGRRLSAWQRMAAPKLFKDAGAGDSPDVLAGQVFKKTDLGNGERFARRYHGSFVYVPAEMAWYYWDRNHWVKDELSKVQIAMKEMFREMQRDVAAVANDDGSSRGGWALQCESMGRTLSSIKAAAAEMSVSAECFDADPWALNVLNGVLNLRTGVLDAHDPQMYCSKLAPVRFDPSARCPKFIAFFEKVMPNPDTRWFVQRLLGYALTGDVGQHIFPVFWGSGGNGKSTIVGVMTGILGGYATTIPSDDLVVGHNVRHETAFARLRGARFVIASESEQDKRLAEGKIKLVTGGDTLPVRFMHGNFFDLKPTHKIFLMTNNRPQIVGQDEGIWRRVALIPFTTRITLEERILHYERELVPEWPGILNWLLQGLQAWLKDGGLGALPAEAQAATDEYRRSEDVFGMFLEDRCERGVGDEFVVESARLIAAVNHWYETNIKDHPPRHRAFGALMHIHGFKACKHGGVRAWSGLRLKGKMNGTESKLVAAVDKPN